MSEQDFDPSGCDIEEAILRSYDGSKTADITASIVGFEISQSMDNVSYNGTITLLDTVGLFENFPLRSEETIQLKIVGYDLNTVINLNVNTYKITDMVPSESTNGVLFTLHFVSAVTFNASKRRISKFFKSSIGGIAKEIFDTYFGRLDRVDYLDIDDKRKTLPFATGRHPIISEPDRNFFIQPTAGMSGLIIPRLTPSESMFFLASRAYAGSETPSQSFRFFETLENFYFCTDEYFIKDISENEVINLFYAPASSVDPRKPEDQINRIESLQIIANGTDTASDIYSGAYKNRVIEIDFIRKNVNKLDFDYSKDARYIDMSGNPRNLNDNPHTESFRNDTFTEENARQFMIFRDYTSNGDIPTSLSTDRHFSEIAANRVSYYHHMNNTILAVGLKGRIDLRPGKIVNLNIKSLNATNGEEINDMLAGRYLIKNVNHICENGILNTSMQLVKFDWSRGTANV